MHFGHLIQYNKESGIGWVEIANGSQIPFIVNPGTDMPAEGSFISFSTGPRAMNIVLEPQPEAEKANAR